MKSKDKMDVLLEMLEFIYENNESKNCTENNLKKRFGDDAYEDLSLFAMGGTYPYLQEMGSKTLGDGVIKLTQLGVRRYFRLRKERGQDKIQEQQIKINQAILLTAIIASMGTISGLMINFNGLNEYMAIIITACLVAILGKIALLYTQASNRQ